MKHASHQAIVVRLKRADGHLKSIIRMIGDGESCVALSQQLHAVEKAVGNAKRELIHDHIEHCLEERGGAPKKSSLQELKQLTKYL